MDMPANLLQLIDADGKFVPNLSDFFASQCPNFHSLGDAYSVIAVLGSQSTGKSTLLNLLFGTNFRVLDARTRGRTTLGVWIGIPTNSPPSLQDGLIVLDVEGTDSTQREDNNSFERRAGLFTLAIASAFVINIKQIEIGRQVAGNFSLMKNIFELNLQLFQKEKTNKTLLIFVIRDFSGETPFDRLTDILKQELITIWSKIQKPAIFSTSLFTDFFDVAYDFLPSPHQEKRAEFLAGIDNLRKKFYETETSSSYLSPIYRRSGIPSDGFAQYSCDIWKIIQENKDLDIPSQKLLLAEYRCGDISATCINEFKSQLETISKTIASSETTICDQFGPKAFLMIAKALNDFEAQTGHYIEEVRNKKLLSLHEDLSKLLFPFFDLQINHLNAKMLISFSRFSSQLNTDTMSVLNSMQTDLKAITKISFVEQTKTFTDEVYSRWEKVFTESIPSNAISTEWNIEGRKDSFRKELHNKARLIKNEVIEFFMNSLYTDVVSRHFVLPIEHAMEQETNVWPKVRQFNIEGVTFIEKETCEALEKGFEIIETDAKKYCSTLLELFHSAVLSAAKEKARTANFRMMKQFEKLFKYDAKSLPRRWKATDNVLEVFTKARTHAELILDTLCYLRLKEEDDEIVFYQVISEVLPDGTKAEEMFLLEEPESLNYDPDNVLLDVDERYDLLMTFREEAKEFLEQALREQEIISSNVHIPFVLLVFLTLLSANEVKAILFNPFYLFFSLIFVGIVYMIYKLGFGSVFESLVRSLFSFTFSSMMNKIIVLFTPGAHAKHLEEEQKAKAAYCAVLECSTPFETPQDSEKALRRSSVSTKEEQKTSRKEMKGQNLPSGSSPSNAERSKLVVSMFDFPVSRDDD